MARYDLEISRTAERQLRRLPRADQARVVQAMLQLATDPYPRGTRKLLGYDDVFRIRVGQYRVLYSVSEATVIVVVLKIGHRRDVYRR
ncbi:MAG: type II toxin-antitoxin system RelE/ParE family toxin [Gammaproteobacteria bacterium]|nr:type II toxin-antitoxin system RelE/ParE family toxin [Gammaproteobacteria bacterium]